MYCIEIRYLFAKGVKYKRIVRQLRIIMEKVVYNIVNNRIESTGIRFEMKENELLIK